MTDEIKKIISEFKDEMFNLGYEAGYKQCNRDYEEAWDRITAGKKNDKKKDV